MPSLTPPHPPTPCRPAPGFNRLLPRSVVQKYVSLCTTCQLKKPQSVKAPLRPILAKAFLSRLQVSIFLMLTTYHVALGEDVSNAIFQQQEMRAHLKMCFEAIELSPFPHTKKTIKNYKRSQLFIHVFLHMPTT